MKKVRSALIMSCLVFLFSLAAVGCTRNGSNAMDDSGMETTMDNMNGEKKGSGMEKDMQKKMK
jgi:hypothetical protein